MTHELGEAATPSGSVFEFRTESRRAQDPEVEPGPAWLLYLGLDKPTPPTRLSFTTVDGAHSAIALGADLGSFLGTRRGADGTVTQLRGTLANRRSFPALPTGVTAQDVLTFTTHEEDEPGDWRRTGRLRILVQDGRSVALRDLEWRDKDGTEAALAFTPDRSGFLGHLRRAGAEPVGYRGFAVPGRPIPTSDELVKELEEFGRQAFGIAEDLIGRIGGWLGGGRGGSGPSKPA
jgi:hypothetical protein